MNQSAIKIKSLEHGKKVKEWLESLGVDCSQARLDNVGAVYCIDNNKCFWSYNNIYNKFTEIFLPSEETLVSKLRNLLTPQYSLAQVIKIYLTERPNDKELEQIILDLTQTSIENQSFIHQLLTQLTDN